MTLPTVATTAASISLVTGKELSLQPGTNQVLTDLKGWHSSTGTRRNSTERLWAHGSFSERGWREERLITVSGHVFSDNRGDAARMTDTLNAALADGTLGTFRVDDVDLGSRSAGVYMSGTPDVDWDGNLDVFFTIDMVAPDPRKYGETLTASTPPAAPGGGLAFDLFTTADGLDFGESGTSGTVTVTNPGTADTAPVFTVTGLASGFTITEISSGSRLVFTDTIPAGHSLVLDASDGSVVLDGTSDRSSFLSRREWTRIPGSGSSTYLFESRGAVGSTLTIGAQPAWW